MKRFPWVAALGLSVSAMIPVAHADLVATYAFNNTLAAQQSGVGALTAVDPEGTSAFVSANVFGNTQTVYHFDGVNSPPADQGGLDFDATGLLSPNNYSVEMVFDLTGNAGWRRLMDSLDRQSDAGLYIDPSNNLDVFPQGGTSAPFTSNTFFDVFVTVAPGATSQVTGYFGGVQQFTEASANLDLTANNTLGFFLDNVVAGGQGEWSSGDVALIKVFNTALTADQVAAETADPFAGVGSTSTPEPGAWALTFAGAAGLALLKRRGWRVS